MGSRTILLESNSLAQKSSPRLPCSFGPWCPHLSMETHNHLLAHLPGSGDKVPPMPLQKNWGRAGPWSHLQPGEDPKAQRGQSFAQSPTEYHQKLETGGQTPSSQPNSGEYQLQEPWGLVLRLQRSQDQAGSGESVSWCFIQIGCSGLGDRRTEEWRADLRLPVRSGV